MMMNFLDLSAASEEERRLIREILSDTSVVNITEPQQTSQLVVPNSPVQTTLTAAPTTTKQQQQQQHLETFDKVIPDTSETVAHQQSSYQHHVTKQQGQMLHQRQPTNSRDHQSQHQKQSQQQQHHHNHNHNQNHHLHNSTMSSSQQTATSVANESQLIAPATATASNQTDMNSPVIGIDMASRQPPGYAIPPQHVAAFGPPPHQLYGGPPIFHQPYHHYLIPSYVQSYVPYVLPPNSVVPPRAQISPQASQPPSSTASNNSTRTHSRPHSHHSPSLHQHPNSEQQFNNVCGDRVENRAQLALNVAPPSNRPIATKTQSSTLPNQSDANGQPPEQDRLNTNDIVSVNEGYNVNDNGERQTQLTSTKNNSRINDGIESHNLQINEGSEAHAKIQSANRIRSVINEDNSKEPDQELVSTNTIRLNGEESLKLSSDEGFDTQSSLDVSKQSHESLLPQIEQPKKSTPESRNKLATENGSKQIEESEVNDNTEIQTKSNVAWGSSTAKSWADLFKRDGVIPSSTVNGETENYVSGSEASEDENKSGRCRVPTKTEVPINTSSLINNSTEQRSQESAKRALDKMAPELAQRISTINLKHALPFLTPRGFINKGNGCYINATLQALIACPPFYNLMKEIGDLGGFKRENSCTPIIDSFAELFLSFPSPAPNKKNKQASPLDQKPNINNLRAEPIEPRSIYNVLGHIKSECLKGAQEDAEEFLSSVLNGLHEEMIGLGDLQSTQFSSAQNGHPSDNDDSNDDIAYDDNLWREVGPKNRSLPIRTAKVINTLVQEIFGGSLFSIRTAGKDRCGHRSPFFDLQLDISGDNVRSVHDAIKSFTATEVIHDFYCSKTKQILDAQRRTSLDQLPPILILHLKQFVYTQDYGLKKLMKKIEYPIDFELPESCLHEKNSTDRNLKTSRSYKLLAVVYHDGKEAIKGHYLTDVYHIGSSQWIRCDDSNLKVISSPRIENPDSTRTPYLLFYRRLNTLRAQTGKHDKKKKI